MSDLSSVYEGIMDPEILALCDALNCIPGVRTIESCSGHLRTAPFVLLKCYSIGSLNILLQSIRPCLNSWELRVIDLDVSEDTDCIYLRMMDSRAGYKNMDLLATAIRNYLKEDTVANS